MPGSASTIIDRLKTLDESVRVLDVDPQRRSDWQSGVQESAERFLAGLDDLPAFGREEGPGDPPADLGVVEYATPLQDVLRTYERQVLGVHINPASPRFFGYIPGGGLYPAALGDYLAAVTNRYSGIFFAAPGAARIEDALVQWIAHVLGYPRTSGGTLTSGGSLANLAAVVTAREEVPFEQRGRAVVYMTGQVHHSMHKALRIAGMGGAVFREVSVDRQFRMDPEALAGQVESDRAEGLLPWLLVSSAGTTNTGCIDPLNDLSDVAERFGLWHHIDAAYGGFFVLWDEGRRLLDGIDRGDSITVDPHKGLFLPYGCGCVLVRDHRKLRNIHSVQADYMQDALTPPDEVSPADYSAELTRHFRGLRLWLPLRLFGLAPFRAALEEKVLLARWFHEQLCEMEDFECHSYPELSVATFRYRPRGVPADDVETLNELNLRLVRAIHSDGRVFLSSTKLTSEKCPAGAVYLRLAVLCFRSHLEHVREALHVLQRLAGAGDW
ncbi:MAG: aspartate aminotransferase family protein [Phycisphaerales bacterium]|nr:MAG: aspartate aminotransferase family protein [Phycisphaerales bacterium]